MAKPVFEVDKRSLRGLNKALVQYQFATKKSFADVANRAAVNLAFRAAQFTHKAQIKKDASYIQNTLGMRNAYAVARWYNKVHRGKVLKTRREVERATNALINARVSARGFIAGGWAKAGRSLKKMAGVKGGARVTGIKTRTGVGRSTMARGVLRAFAELVNASLSKSPSSAAALAKYGGEGLNKSVRFVAADMLTYAREKLAQQARKFNRS